jgi:hypothetical protein
VHSALRYSIPSSWSSRMPRWATAYTIGAEPECCVVVDLRGPRYYN